MKMLCTLTFFSFICITGAAQAGATSLPLDKRISMEKLMLVEEYQTALQRCREHTRKAAKNSCIQHKKDSLTKTLEYLQRDPKTYFINKEGQFRDEKSLDQENMIRQGKSH